MASTTDRRISEIERRLLDLHAAAGHCLSLAAQSQAGALGKILQQDLDIGVWEERLQGRYEVQLLASARREIGFALYCAATGLYAQAFSSLRLFLELSFATVFFSINELEWRRWLNDRKDFVWSAALDRDEGVLAESFVREFYPAAVSDAPTYRELAQRSYRKCSQHVHGKFAVTQSLPRTIKYDRNALEIWSSTAHDAGQSVLYLLYCRYGDDLLSLDDGRLATILEHSFSHLPSVRRSLERSAER
jgi:hypothetical protein